jgi:hypothetical protein
VLVVERLTLARLRHQRFFSLAALNAAIAALVEDLNARPMRKLGVSRRQLFEQLDQPALSPLPSEPFVYAEWRIRRVSLDYHVDIEGHYYSVPHRLLRASRPASPRAPSSCSTRASASPCMCAAVRAGRCPSRCRGRIDGVRSGRSNGSAARRLPLGRDGETDDADPAEPAAPGAGLRACLGILRLVRSYGRERLEAACARGLEIGARSYGSVQSILQHGLDRRAPSANSHTGELPLLHSNIRGSRYYH